MRDFKTLKVWDRAHELVLAVYEATASFPKDELYGLTSQMRRSASSIPTNIAEGCGRDGEAELARFCLIAMGSASELEYQLLLAKDLGLLAEGAHQTLAKGVVEVKQMLSTFIRALRPRPNSRGKRLTS